MFTLKCEKCGEEISTINHEYVYDRDPMQYNARLRHFECADFGTPMTTERRAAWNTWKLQKLYETSNREIRELRGRTQALRGVVMDLMRRAGLSKADLDDFDFEYGFREEQD